MPRLTLCGLAALTLLIAAGSASATTLYRWVDAQGVVHYSDTPQPGAQKINVQDAQTYRAPPLPKSGATQGSSSGAPPHPTYQCSIITPTAQQSFFNPESVPVSVSVSPGLSGADHTISATVRDSDGTTLCTTAPVLISVQRPSLNSPTSPARGH